MWMIYEDNLRNVSEFPKYYLGEEVNTPEGKGIIVSLKMPTNGLYISPEKSEVIVWFGVSNRTKWVQKDYSLQELSEYN
jgi:hypothetical protein